MPIVERHIRIEAPPDAVWSVLVDLPGQPRWMHDLRDVRVQTPGPPAAGTVAIGTVHMFGLRQADPIEIIAFDPPSHYSVRHLGAFRGTGTFWLVPLDSGSATHVRWREELYATPDAFSFVPALSRAPFVGRAIRVVAATLAQLGDPLLIPVFTAVFRQDLRRLKRLVETGRV